VWLKKICTTKSFIKFFKLDTSSRVGKNQGIDMTDKDNQAKPPVATSVTDNGSGKPPTVVQITQVGKYKVEVIREKCIGAASCVAIAPLVFDLDEENIARIISQDGNDDDTKLLAAQSCPTAAIIVTDTTTGQQVWPR
jgi:ferredoxin